MTRDEAINTLAHFKVYISGGGVVDKKANEAIDFAIATLIKIADRPQGEWIRTGRTNIYGGIEVQCSNCNDKVMVQHLEDEWYCRHCGADMGMKVADDGKAVEGRQVTSS